MVEPDSEDDRARVVNVLIDNHRAFLRFLEKRVGDRALAEDLLQDAFARNLDRVSEVPDEGLGAVVLPRAAQRRDRSSPPQEAEERALAAFTQELDSAQPSPEGTSRDFARVSVAWRTP